ncbi:uncharacterized protein B0I36DRAFT_337509 [Microdochium trichocladiopsis]|uniref:Uncharacterized protein n=1 Tax=Microdochium trichocladiopsis TaxID=1682393 RepID=A0A9P9BMF2_9PEZI|nr:uncharacterized protein B0I36DRAFT_337509 [Microdochium trichocladiopsis]KAH7016375.1 hypothetical protein B0I36DRAFT_337509 [Microdochium trichocladiopsis]
MLCTAMLPALSRYLLGRMDASAKDFLIAKGSIVLLVAGCFGLFLAASAAGMIISLVLFTLGTGLP